MLAVIETHPVQYHAPVYRSVQQKFRIPVTAIYGSDFSVAGSIDPEFGAKVAWDTDLLSGYSHRFLARVQSGGGKSTQDVRASGISAAVADIKPAAILLLGYSLPFHRAAFFASWRAARPMLFRGETTDHARNRSPVFSSVRDNALRLFYSRFARLLYLGTRSRTHFERLGVPDERLVFSPYCVDTAPFRPVEQDREVLRRQARRDLGITDDRIVLLYSGKLSRRKGVHLLLEAVKDMESALRNRITLVFLGSGELGSVLAHSAPLGNHVDARFAGFQNQSALSPFYHAADLLVLPSVSSETWGLVVNDAMHHGLPCVVSDAVGCAPDLVVPGTTGEVCDADSIPGLKSAIDRAIALTGRSDVRAACRRKVEAYSIDQAARGIADAFLGATRGR